MICFRGRALNPTRGLQVKRPTNEPKWTQLGKQKQALSQLKESPVFIGMARMPMACLATRKELWLFLGRRGRGFNRVGMFCGGVVGGQGVVRSYWVFAFEIEMFDSGEESNISRIFARVGASADLIGWDGSPSRKSGIKLFENFNLQKLPKSVFRNKNVVEILY